jgi:DNA-binding MarR family transcriptional regulator
MEGMEETGGMPANILMEIRETLESERLVTARLVDAVLRADRLAASATPEMTDMFGEWISLVGARVLREAEERGGCDVSALARAIGVSETTVFSILVSLHRSGKIRVESVRFSKGDGRDAEACDCLTRED